MVVRASFRRSWWSALVLAAALAVWIYDPPPRRLYLADCPESESDVLGKREKTAACLLRHPPDQGRL